jgi:hypothetical protein
MRFQVLTAASMKMAVFWVVAPCSLVEVYRRFRDAYCFHQPRRQQSSGKIIFLLQAKLYFSVFLIFGVFREETGRVKILN